LIDFGAGRIVHDKYLPTTLVMGNVIYMPPESSIEGYHYTDETFMSGDIWELGMLLYEMLDFPLNMLKAVDIQKNDFRVLMKAPYSPEIKNLVKDLCIIDPFSRPKINEVLEKNVFTEFRVVHIWKIN